MHERGALGQIPSRRGSGQGGNLSGRGAEGRGAGQEPAKASPAGAGNGAPIWRCRLKVRAGLLLWPGNLLIYS